MMKIRNEIKQSRMILLIIAMAIVGMSGPVVAADPNFGTFDEMTSTGALLSTALPDIKANGQDGPITVTSISIVSITIGLTADLQTGTLAYWWLVASTPAGLYSWVFPAGWSAGLITGLQFPMFNFSGLEMLRSTLTVGDYVFYFGVDTSPDNILDSPLAYDWVEVHVIN